MAHDARHSSTSVPDCVSSAAVARTVVSLPDYPQRPRPATPRQGRSERRRRRESHATASRRSSTRRRAWPGVGATASSRRTLGRPGGEAFSRAAAAIARLKGPRSKHLKRSRAKSSEHRADVDSGAARADRHLRRPQVIRPLRQLMADEAADAVDADDQRARQGRRVRAAGEERRRDEQRGPRQGRRDERGAQPEPPSRSARGNLHHAEWYTPAACPPHPAGTSPASRSSPPRC